MGVEISRKTMGGWMGQSAALLDPLYQSLKNVLLESKVIGTDDTTVKVLDRKLDFARIGRIWPYLGDQEHPVIVYDYTPTRERAGPDKFLGDFRGYLQADAYSGYDSFFTPERGMIEVGCWMHGRRYFINQGFGVGRAAHGAGARADCQAVSDRRAGAWADRAGPAGDPSTPVSPCYQQVTHLPAGNSAEGLAQQSVSCNSVRNYVLHEDHEFIWYCCRSRHSK
jgi:hypothetical protein